MRTVTARVARCVRGLLDRVGHLWSSPLCWRLHSLHFCNACLVLGPLNGRVELLLLLGTRLSYVAHAAVSGRPGRGARDDRVEDDGRFACAFGVGWAFEGEALREGGRRGWVSERVGGGCGREREGRGGRLPAPGPLRSRGRR